MLLLYYTPAIKAVEYNTRLHHLIATMHLCAVQHCVLYKPHGYLQPDTLLWPLLRLGVKHPRVAHAGIITVVVIARLDRVHVDIDHPPRQIGAVHRTRMVLYTHSVSPRPYE